MIRIALADVVLGDQLTRDVLDLGPGALPAVDTRRCYEIPVMSQVVPDPVVQAAFPARIRQIADVRVPAQPDPRDAPGRGRGESVARGGGEVRERQGPVLLGGHPRHGCQEPAELPGLPGGVVDVQPGEPFLVTPYKQADRG